MKISCNVIQDLLPLYIEKLASKDSATLVEEHIKTCTVCKNRMRQMNDEAFLITTQNIVTRPLEVVKNDIKKRKLKAVFFSALIVFLIMFTIFAYLSKPIYVSYFNDNITINELSNGDINIKFKDDVTAYNIEEHIEDGKKVIYIVAWSSILDKLMKQTPQNNIMLTSETRPNEIYYCDYTNEGNTILLYGAHVDTNEGCVVLPRLFLTYYFIIALITSMVIGCVWFIFKRNNKMFRVCEYMFFVPIAYMMGQILIKGGFNFVTFSGNQDLIMIVVTAITIYGIIMIGLSMFRQYRLDKCL